MKCRQFLLLLSTALITCLYSCKNNFDDPAEGQAERNSREINEYLIANGLASDSRSTGSGLTYLITGPASATRVVQSGEEVELAYRLGYLDKGQVRLVDTSAMAKPVRLPFGAGVMIAGLEEGLRLMRFGQRNVFFMPNNLAFGAGRDSLQIPPYSAVVMDVTLRNIRSESDLIRAYIQASRLPATPTFVSSDSTVTIYRTQQGSGAAIAARQRVTLSRIGRTLRSTTPFEKIDSVTVRIGAGELIPAGLDQAVQQLRVGDKATVVLRSSVGYGSQGLANRTLGVYVVPPYAPIVYELSVLASRN